MLRFGESSAGRFIAGSRCTPLAHAAAAEPHALLEGEASTALLVLWQAGKLLVSVVFVVVVVCYEIATRKDFLRCAPLLTSPIGSGWGAMVRKPRRHRGVLPQQSNEGTRGDPGVVQADGRSVPSWGGMLLTCHWGACVPLAAVLHGPFCSSRCVFLQHPEHCSQRLTE